MEKYWHWPIVRRVFFETIAKLFGCKEYGQNYIPRWDGGYDKYGRRHRNVWKKLASFLNKVGCDNFPSYILFACQYLRCRVYPNQLYSKNLWQNYQKFKQFRLLKLQLELVATGLTVRFWQDKCSPEEVEFLIGEIGPSLVRSIDYAGSSSNE